MKRSLGLIALMIVGAATFGLAIADHHEGSAAQDGMPLLGPPEEIKELAFMVGTWDAVVKMRQSPEMPWDSAQATGVFEYVAGGACLQQSYSTEVNGMPFLGLGHTTFNRATGEWMDTWVDNVGGRMSVYTGHVKDGQRIVTGTDHMFGQIWLTRVTVDHVGDTHTDWLLEHSTDDGKTWGEYMHIAYDKRSK